MNSRRRLLRDRRLYIILNVTACQGPSAKSLKETLRSGADIIQLRCKEADSGAFLKYAARLRRLTSSCGILFIVNDRADVAIASQADGLHIGQEDITPSMARAIMGKDKLIGLSTHSRRQAEEALSSSDVDYIGIGPVFATSLKPHTRPIGLKAIKTVAAGTRDKPVFALGGITTKNAAAVISSGIDRIAVSQAVFNSKRPAEAVKRFKEILS